MFTIVFFPVLMAALWKRKPDIFFLVFLWEQELVLRLVACLGGIWSGDYDTERSGLSGISVIDGTIEFVCLFLIPALALCLWFVRVI